MNFDLNLNWVRLRNIAIDGHGDIDIAGNLHGDANFDRDLTLNLHWDRDINRNLHRDINVASNLDGLRSDTTDNFNGIRDIDSNLNFLRDSNADGNVVRDVHIRDAFDVVRDVDFNFNGVRDIDRYIDWHGDLDLNWNRNIHGHRHIHANFDRVGAGHRYLTRHLNGSVNVDVLGNINVRGDLARDINHTLLRHRARNELFNGERDRTSNLLDLLNRNCTLARDNLFNWVRDGHLDVIRNGDRDVNILLKGNRLVYISGNVLVENLRLLLNELLRRGEGLEVLTRCRVVWQTTEVTTEVSIETSTWEAEGLCSDGKD
jgi:hypothetical protein